MKIALSFALLLGPLGVWAQKNSFLKSEEKAFLARARQKSYVATQAKAQLARQSEKFYANLLAGQEQREAQLFANSLEGMWAARDLLDNEELFFKILEREFAPRE